MKLQAGEVWNAVEALDSLAKESIPPKGKYWINRMLDKLAGEYKRLTEERNRLVGEHGKEMEGGGRGIDPKTMPAEFAAYMQEWMDLMVTELEVECPKIKLALLGDQAVKTDLRALDKFIEE